MKAKVNRGKRKNNNPNLFFSQPTKASFNDRNNNHNISGKLKNNQNRAKGKPYRRSG